MTAPPLTILLAAARTEYAAETPIRLHTSHAPKLLDADGVTSHYPDEGGLGLPFTAELHRLFALRERPGPDFLVRRSIDEVRDWCRSRHVEHDQGEVSPLCGQLIWMAVVGHADPDAMAHVLRRPPASVRSLLIGALQHAADWREGQRTKYMVLAEAETHGRFSGETVADRLRREHDLIHEQRAWNLTRAKFPDILTWDEEFDRRQGEHRKLGCEGCPLAVAA